jgi:hypothetical protein
MGTRKPRDGIVVRGAERKYDDTGRLDVIAFTASNVDGVRTRLMPHDVQFRDQVVPLNGDTRIFLDDPDGIRGELNFSSAQALRAAAGPCLCFAFA